jgi:hypothetical protein
VHQTFYIDIDEEITSIVDRLRKSKSKEVVIVVPKRAILIQSIVNLKLLKKESESFKKELIIVTQDKLGKMLIEKAGIEVEQKLDDIDGWEVEELNNMEDELVDINLDNGNVNEKIGKNKKNFNQIGSAGYYQSGTEPMDEPIVYSEKRNKEIFQEEMDEERIINKELVTDVSEELRKQQPSFRNKRSKGGVFAAPMDMIRNVEIIENNIPIDEAPAKVVKNSPRKIFKQETLNDFKEEYALEQEFEEDKIEKANKFFEQRKPSSDSDDKYRNIRVGSSVGRYFFLFTLVAVLAILGSAAYLFLPQAAINVFVRNKVQSVELQVDGNNTASSADLVNELIPVKAVALSSELTESYEATGVKDSSNQKARGAITIYNEFSTSPQPLVATTRFESADKKIFRLVKAVTIPGMEKVGAENKPGAIEAEVIADDSGSEYNIAPTSFSIPGFESSGGDKYAKIYAKSFSAMIGGGQGSQKVKIVSDNDINIAKTKALQELKVSITQKLKDSVGAEYVFLEDAVSVDDAAYTLTKSSGDVADNFSITVRATANALTFKGSDLNAIVINALSKKGERGAQIPENSIHLDFGKADVNLKEGNLVIRVHATGSIVPEIDLEKIKQALLGKTEAEIQPYITGHASDIEKVEVVYWPSFITGKIPAYESRVTISLDPLAN